MRSTSGRGIGHAGFLGRVITSDNVLYGPPLLSPTLLLACNYSNWVPVNACQEPVSACQEPVSACQANAESLSMPVNIPVNACQPVWEVAEASFVIDQLTQLLIRHSRSPSLCFVTSL